MRLAPYTLRGVFSRRECGSKARAKQKRAPAIDICDVRMMIMTCRRWRGLAEHSRSYICIRFRPARTLPVIPRTRVKPHRQKHRRNPYKQLAPRGSRLSPPADSLIAAACEREKWQTHSSKDTLSGRKGPLQSGPKIKHTESANQGLRRAFRCPVQVGSRAWDAPMVYRDDLHCTRSLARWVVWVVNLSTNSHSNFQLACKYMTAIAPEGATCVWIGGR